MRGDLVVITVLINEGVALSLQVRCKDRCVFSFSLSSRSYLAISIQQYMHSNYLLQLHEGSKNNTKHQDNKMEPCSAKRRR